MPELLDRLGIEALQPAQLGWVAGVLLLGFGRRLYWLFCGVVGFFAGLYLLQGLVPAGPQWVTLLGSLLTGAFGALVAVFFQKVALGVAGFLAGGYTAFWLAQQQGWGENLWLWVGIALAGVVGALVVRWVFEVGLVLLTSLLGASFLVEAAGWSESPRVGVIFLALAAAGAVFQFATGGRRKKKD